MVSGAFSEEMLVDRVVSSGLGFGFATLFNNFITDLADTGNSLLPTDNTIHPSISRRDNEPGSHNKELVHSGIPRGRVDKKLLKKLVVKIETHNYRLPQKTN